MAAASVIIPKRDIDGSNQLFTQPLLAWFQNHGRHDLPWQHPRTAYRVWLSEIMLQQTQVSTVIPYFQRFISVFPNIKKLAEADNDQVMAQWAGLGYYARARNLHAAAKYCVQHYQAQLPDDFTALHALPGIGRSTAGAILAQAWKQPFAILDGNVKRVLTRYYGIEGYPGQKTVEKQLWAWADKHIQAVATEDIADYTQAQMDLGATICTLRKPACLLCPLQMQCVAYKNNRIAYLPTPKPSKSLPQRHAVAIVLENTQGQILLQKRPPLGIWACLWTLPQADTKEQLFAWLQHYSTADYEQAQPLPPIQHVFSHYRLHLKLLYLRKYKLQARVADDDQFRYVDRNQWSSLGIPAPIRKFLDALPQSC